MLFARSQQVVLGKEMEVQAMETKTRQDATRGHIRPLALPALTKLPFVYTTFGAVTDGEDATVKLRFTRCSNRTCLVQIAKKIGQL